MRAELSLGELVEDFAASLEAVDGRAPVWVSTTTGKAYAAGIGPHTENTVRLVVGELLASKPDRYPAAELGVPHPASPRQKCDLMLSGPGAWALEVKMLRFLGDNGKANDNILMHILSPYPAHRSALTDCEKLLRSGFTSRTGVLIYGYDYEHWPMDPAIDAFERLASNLVTLSERSVATFEGLVHPVHRCGRVFGWEILGGTDGAG